MMKRIMSKRPTIKKRKMSVLAAAITTLLSATAAFAVIKVAKKVRRVKKSELETVLDGLVESGTITQEQEVAIHDAITSAIEAATVTVTDGDNGELEVVAEDSNVGTLSSLKTSLFKERSEQLKKPAQSTAI